MVNLMVKVMVKLDGHFEVHSNRGRSKRLDAMLRPGTEVTLRDFFSRTHWDTSWLHNLLVKLGGDAFCTNFRFDEGETLLHRAVVVGRALHVRVLIDAGVPLDAKDALGRTALHYICMTKPPWSYYPPVGGYVMPGEVDAKIRVLIDAGADPEVRDMHSATPLMLSAKGHRTTAFKTLLAHEVDITKTTMNQNTILHLLASSDNASMLQDILDTKRLDIDVQNTHGGTALFSSEPATLSILLQNGANMSIKNHQGMKAPAWKQTVMTDAERPVFDAWMVLWNTEIQRR